MVTGFGLSSFSFFLEEMVLVIMEIMYLVLVIFQIRLTILLVEIY